ncbi:MAG: VPLPA-CTERM sorting domain-containing protein [Roseicyclus sp.]
MKLTNFAAGVAVAVFSAGSAVASTVNTTANVVFIVDESGTMVGEQEFLRNTVVDRLDSELAAAGVTNRSYATVGFGGGGGGNLGADNLGRIVGGGLTSDTGDAKADLALLGLGGSFEDGYSAIDFALNNITFTPGAAVNLILVTDEDRDNGNSSLTRESIQQVLTDRNILLNAIVDNTVDADSTMLGNQPAIGVDADGNAYRAGAGGAFTSVPTGQLTDFDSGSTRADYSELALATGGAVWDIEILRNGGDDATSFANAFIDIKVSEIISQPPVDTNVIPLPAGAWLMLAGIGAFGVMRRRQQKMAA